MGHVCICNIFFISVLFCAKLEQREMNKETLFRSIILGISLKLIKCYRVMGLNLEAYNVPLSVNCFSSNICAKTVCVRHQ